MARLPQHLMKGPVGRERLPRDELARLQRDRYLVAATGVFAKRGFQETTIDHIVAAAKASVGSFYQHFEGKEDCFLAVCDGIIERWRGQISEAVEAADGWAEAAFAGLRTLLELTVADPLSARIVLIEAQTAGPIAEARREAQMEAAVDRLRDGRKLYPPARNLPQTYERAAVTGLAFFLEQRLLSSERNTVDSLLADSAQVLLEPIVGEREFKRLSGELTRA